MVLSTNGNGGLHSSVKAVLQCLQNEVDWPLKAAQSGRNLTRNHLNIYKKDLSRKFYLSKLG